MKKVLFVLAIMACVTFAMVSCTNNGGTGGVTSGNPTTTETATTPGAPVTNEDGSVVTDENGETVTTPPVTGGIENVGANTEGGWGPIQK